MTLSRPAAAEHYPAAAGLREKQTIVRHPKGQT